MFMSMNSSPPARLSAPCGWQLTTAAAAFVVWAVMVGAMSATQPAHTISTAR
jgi:hypothetical protein